MFYSEQTIDFLLTSLETLALLFIFVLGISVLVVMAMFVIDISQTKHAIRRNYPVIGRFRYLFENMGEFFRQYFFAMDREELPFNRAQRSWCYRASKNVNNTTAFGSTRNLNVPGTVLFVNCPYPTLDEDAAQPEPVTIGAGCENPYTTSSIINISGMSYGAISKPAVLALSNGARMAGCWMNTGEGGILPAAKVTDEIAAIRGIPAGSDSISPNRHPEINNNQELLDFIERIRSVAGKPVGFKAVVGAYEWLDSFCELIHKRGPDSAPDFITVDGAEGGTGAAPLPLIDCMGLPLNESLPLVIDTLKRHGLRDRIKVIASGKLVTPADVAWAYCMGVDFVNSARCFMFALGCIQALQYNKNTCPTGITTHDRKLQKGLDIRDKTTRVMHYAQNISYEVGIIAHSCGVKSPRDLKRYHARVVAPNGLSVPLNELYPDI